MLDLDFALTIFENAEKLLLKNEYEVSTLKVLELAQKSGCSAYDCEYVSLAKDLKVPLITMDKKLLKNFPKIAISVNDFISK